MKFKTINPATEEVIKEFETMSEQEVMKIANSVNKAYDSWKDVPLKKKSDLLKKLSSVLKKNKKKYAKIMSLEMGKPFKDAIVEVEKCAWCCDVYAENANKWLKDDIRKIDGIEHKIILQPLGVILAIMPWNYPFWQVMRFAIPTMLVGNTALLKHASNVTESALALEEAFKEAGYPKNTFRTLIADHESITKLLGTTFVRGVSLTGSTQAGKKVMETAGKHLKRVVLELGGSDAFIVCEDANLDFVTKGATAGRFNNNGQSCIAAKRFIVHESIAEEFEKKFTEKTCKLKVGDPFDKKATQGPLVNKQAVEQIEAQVMDAKKKGARILTGGKRKSGKGFYFEPTVITDTKPNMKVVYEEVFGPVASIITFKDDKEAIKIANSTEFGLGGSVWTKDLKRGKKIAEQVETGAIFVNSITKSDPRMPFGGIKESGIGRELSELALKEFANVKSFNVYKHG